MSDTRIKPSKKDKELYKRLYGLDMKDIIHNADKTFKKYMDLITKKTNKHE